MLSERYPLALHALAIGDSVTPDAGVLDFNKLTHRNDPPLGVLDFAIGLSEASLGTWDDRARNELEATAASAVECFCELPRSVRDKFKLRPDIIRLRLTWLEFVRRMAWERSNPVFRAERKVWVELMSDEGKVERAILAGGTKVTAQWSWGRLLSCYHVSTLLQDVFVSSAFAVEELKHAYEDVRGIETETVRPKPESHTPGQRSESELPVPGRGVATRQGDIKSDTGKKIHRRRRQMNRDAAECVKRFKSEKRRDPTVTMKSVVEDYVGDHKGRSFTGIMRRLNDNTEQWRILPSDDT